MPLAIIGVGVISESRIPRCQTVSELRVRRDPGVDDIRSNTDSTRKVDVMTVQWQIFLVNPIKPPIWRVYLVAHGGDDLIGLDVLNRWIAVQLGKLRRRERGDVTVKHRSVMIFDRFTHDRDCAADVGSIGTGFQDNDVTLSEVLVEGRLR